VVFGEIMKTKSSDEILLFLVKNSMPEYYKFPVSDEPNTNHIWERSPLEKILLRLSGNMRFLCPLKKFEEFVGESYSFEKHLCALHEQEILFITGISFDEVHGTYQKSLDSTTGLIKNYETGIRYIAFHYRENNFLEDFDNILDDAKKLGLLKKRTKLKERNIK
jgi:hypothetical protein